MPNLPTAAVTGASGYVGSRIAAGLGRSFRVIPIGRNSAPPGVRWSFTPNVSQPESIASALTAQSITTLIHSAWDFSHASPTANWQTNVEGSRRLLDDAATAGVTRLIFISTISAFPTARSEYGKSKLAVEKFFLERGGTVIRPGLVWGDTPGGMFASLRAQVAKSSTIPAIGDGRYPQFLVHEDDLAETIRLIALDASYSGRTLTVANPKPWLLRDLILRLAQEHDPANSRSVKLVGIPWRLIHTALKTAETLGLKPKFRSDSVISLVYQDPSPAFDALDPIPLRPFT